MKESHDSADGWSKEYFEGVIMAMDNLISLKYDIECSRRSSDDPQDLIDEIMEYVAELEDEIDNL